MREISALGPIDPSSVPEVNEEETTAPWIMRKLVGSMTGRIVLSSYETLRAAGTNVVCLSPWGDSSPLFLPCIRFRDLAVHTVIAVTGGMAAVAAPVMAPVADVVATSFGDTIFVELGIHAGFDLTTKLANDLVFDMPLKKILPIHSRRLETTGVKVLLITLRYKHTMSDAALGFYRSSLHSDTSLFAAVKDYLAVEKGWFSPYLFATARRPIIPRSMKPDVVFCHGPFLSGDYKIGETLLNESASVITLCDPPPPAAQEPNANQIPEKPEHKHSLSLPSLSKFNIHARSRTPSPEPALTPLPPPPVPRRLVILVVGLKPHRKAWSLSARPGESVIRYVLLNGCPAIVVPAKLGAPLLAWDTLTLEKIWDVELPPLSEGGEGSTETIMRSASGRFEGVVDVIFEYLDLCVDWERFTVPSSNGVSSPGDVRNDVKPSKEKEESGTRNLGAKGALKDAVTLLVAAAIRSKTSEEAKKELDADRSGIAMWRIP
ncbi:hypothetical protein M413DRAFT_10359 [Hebeloma cylindrosporum]|uniref:Uncharacterized protein n=1 Tax=Hebeloma cylindrosporum TaxID=76867 RepID=A0A0C3BZW6_HEBCY|nr:hypothetical protein M413DRAFT_10359 [Hebeloma cylindrosporum h7]